ncbi:hypothetical protein ACA910_007325 [Epithemia clementina (nom. ined.)]
MRFCSSSSSSSSSLRQNKEKEEEEEEEEEGFVAEDTATTATTAHDCHDDEDDHKNEKMKQYINYGNDGDGDDDDVVDDDHEITRSIKRRELLHHQLQLLDIDAQDLDQAAMQSIQNPILGYNGRYGKSAIRAYRSFVYPRKRSNNNKMQAKRKQHQDPDHQPPETTTFNSPQLKRHEQQQLLVALAMQTAQQIAFLRKRHEAHELEWIRHHDNTHHNKINNNVTNNNLKVDALQRPSHEQGNANANDADFPKIILILDNLRSALNVGSLFRTAEATKCQAVWTIGITPHPQGNGADKIHKSALGAERLVPSRHFPTLQKALAHLRGTGEPEPKEDEEGQQQTEQQGPSLQPPDKHTSTKHHNNLHCYQVVALETTQQSVDYTSVRYYSTSTTTSSSSGDTSICSTTTTTKLTTTNDKVSKRKGVALVLGNEVTGVTPSLLSEMDVLVEIPTYGIKNSLNVAACAPIVLYEIIRQWKEHQRQKQPVDQQSEPMDQHGVDAGDRDGDDSSGTT